jgi:hypothetical protein
LSCKKKVFKRFLFFSMVFCIFSVFYNGILHADTSKDTDQPNSQISYVKMQQERIINSLKNIESCLTASKGDKDE